MLKKPKLNIFQTIDYYQHDLDYEPHTPCEPTDAQPGSLEKVQVMCDRILRGEELHHEDDAQLVATVEAQNEMRHAILICARVTREESRLKKKLSGKPDRRLKK